MDDVLTWTEAQAVPRLVDGLVPQLVKDTVPKIIDGVMPEIRARWLPVMIDDLTTEPRIRDLITEQSRTVLHDVTDQVRSSTASADDRVESAFRRLFPGSHNHGDHNHDDHNHGDHNNSDPDEPTAPPPANPAPTEG